MLTKLAIILMLTLSICSCRTVKTIPVETIQKVIQTDTLYINNVQVDSIYISHDLLTDRSHDTILIKETTTEYRYKLLRDTIYRTKLEIQRDSIPYEVRVVDPLNERGIPPWIQVLAWIGGIAILLLVFFFLITFRQFINLLLPFKELLG